tara:strand:+ start:631 stop:1347 length:717 start_codon:yes stop_codon:yes gene_type:complete
MKKIYENWRRFQEEGTINNFPFQVYCDLDGVLVDFEGGVVKRVNFDLENPAEVPDIGTLRKKYDKMVIALSSQIKDADHWRTELKINFDDFDKESENQVRAVRTFMYARFEDDLEFWTNLDWMEDGRALWNYVKRLDPPVLILTAPMSGEGSHEGKIRWVKKNLALARGRIFLSAEKWEMAVDKDTGAQNVLIDDTPKKVSPWEDEGGIGILHTSTADTIKKLEKIKAGSDIPEEPLE